MAVWLQLLLDLGCFWPVVPCCEVSVVTLVNTVLETNGQSCKGEKKSSCNIHWASRHTCWSAVVYTKELGKVEYESMDMVMNNLPLCQSHHWFPNTDGFKRWGMEVTVRAAETMTEQSCKTKLQLVCLMEKTKLSMLLCCPFYTENCLKKKKKKIINRWRLLQLIRSKLLWHLYFCRHNHIMYIKNVF